MGHLLPMRIYVQGSQFAYVHFCGHKYHNVCTEFSLIREETTTDCHNMPQVHKTMVRCKQGGQYRCLIISTTSWGNTLSQHVVGMMNFFPTLFVFSLKCEVKIETDRLCDTNTVHTITDNSSIACTYIHTYIHTCV